MGAFTSKNVKESDHDPEFVDRVCDEKADDFHNLNDVVAELLPEQKCIPEGKYAGTSYLEILENNPTYMLRIADGRYSNLLVHARPWISQNKEFIEMVRRDGNNKYLGENVCGLVLRTMGIKYVREFKIETLKWRKFDYQFIHNDQKYLLEIDGYQHFQFPNVYHENLEAYKKTIKSDVEKTVAAIRNGFKLIRIALVDTEYGKIRKHITTSLKILPENECDFYFSDRDIYRPMVERISSLTKGKICIPSGEENNYTIFHMSEKNLPLVSSQPKFSQSKPGPSKSTDSRRIASSSSRLPVKYKSGYKTRGNFSSFKSRTTQRRR